ncbi:MAG: ATP synthase F1 subunit delta [Fusobacteriota bacterium]
MTQNKIGDRYAQAMYDLTKEKDIVMTVYEELKSLIELYKENEEFSGILDHPEVTKQEKKKLINGIFKSKFDSQTLNLVNYIIDKGRFMYIEQITDQYLKLYQEAEGIEEVEAIFATDLDEDQKERLIKKLKKMTSKQIELNLKVDESILGGGILKIGDQIIDGSLKRQFEMLRSNL